MTRKFIATWGMIVVLLASMVGSAAAQETAPTPEPTPPAGPTTTLTYAHPVVQVLAAYFGRKAAANPAPTATPDPLATPDPDAAPEVPAAPVLGPEEIAAQIAQYHEDGMGFGVLVKLYAMAEASAEACAQQPAGEPAGEGEAAECAAVTVEELVAAFQGGAGMGQLFKEYGKPALLGVGHVKQQLKNQPPAGDDGEVVEAPTDGDAPETEALLSDDNQRGNGNGKSNKPLKDKPVKEKPNKKNK